MLTTFPLRVPSAKTKKRLTATALEEKLLGHTVSPDARKSERPLSANRRAFILRAADIDLRDMINNNHNDMLNKYGVTGHVVNISTYDVNHRNLCIEYVINRDGGNPICDIPNRCCIPKYAKYTIKQLYEIWVRHVRAAIKS